MIDLYYWSTPNGHKITMFLEETGLKYNTIAINIGKGDQFKPEFLAVAPNNRIPAMVDHEPKGGASRSRSSRPVRWWCISPRRPESSSPPISTAEIGRASCRGRGGARVWGRGG